VKITDLIGLAALIGLAVIAYRYWLWIKRLP
jgi:hypothetical protein